MGSAASNPFAATDADLVRSGDAMLTAGGILALGETVTTVVTFGLLFLGSFAGPENAVNVGRGVAAVDALCSVGTLIAGGRCFDVKRRGLI
jgi:hypothetical protein